jgi:ATP-dependent protease HslVU (ClpYQ) ATPase subunit
MENLIEEISYEACGDKEQEIVIDSKYVTDKLGGDTKIKDLKKFIL